MELTLLFFVSGRVLLHDQLAGDLPGGGNGEELGLTLGEKKRTFQKKYFKLFFEKTPSQPLLHSSSALIHR